MSVIFEEALACVIEGVETHWLEVQSILAGGLLVVEALEHCEVLWLGFARVGLLEGVGCTEGFLEEGHLFATALEGDEREDGELSVAEGYLNGRHVDEFLKVEVDGSGLVCLLSA